jgi:hypothetical protein
MEIKVSIGELLDKLTILYIKKSKLKDPDKLANVSKEYEYLLTKVSQKIKDDKQFERLCNSLVQVNSELWDIEHAKRESERNQDFGENFIHLARQVYIKNDLRAAIKKEINTHFKSEFTEEKSYEKY